MPVGVLGDLRTVLRPDGRDEFARQGRVGHVRDLELLAVGAHDLQAGVEGGPEVVLAVEHFHVGCDPRGPLAQLVQPVREHRGDPEGGLPVAGVQLDGVGVD